MLFFLYVVRLLRAGFALWSPFAQPAATGISTISKLGVRGAPLSVLTPAALSQARFGPLAATRQSFECRPGGGNFGLGFVDAQVRAVIFRLFLAFRLAGRPALKLLGKIARDFRDLLHMDVKKKHVVGHGSPLSACAPCVLAYVHL